MYCGKNIKLEEINLQPTVGLFLFYVPNDSQGTLFYAIKQMYLCQGRCRVVWTDRAIYWTLGNFSKPLATINLPESPTFLGNFYKGVKIFNFSNETILGQLL